MITVLKRYLPAKVVLTAVLIAIATSLLFNGIMIGPEYQRYKPPYLVLPVLLIVTVFFVRPWWRGSRD